MRYNFNEEDAAETFENECLLKYERIRKYLCGDCAVQAIEDLVEDVYYETCDRCRKTFDLIEEEYEFEQMVSGTTLRDYWNPSILCAECTKKEIG